MRFGEALELLGVALGNAAWVAARTTVEAARFGASPWWWRLRLALAAEWAGQTPLQVIAREQGGLSDEDVVYGETLPGTAVDLLRRVGVGPGDRVVDLGCGRGVVPLVAGLFFGARALGVEALPGYVERARRAALRLGLPGVEFQVADFRSEPLPPGTVYFLAGTCLEEGSWRAVTARLATAAPGARALSLSAPLPEEQWHLLERVRMPFSWGPATVYLHRRRGQARPSAPAGARGRRRGGTRSRRGRV